MGLTYLHRGRTYCLNSGATASVRDVPTTVRENRSDGDRVLCSECGRSVAVNKHRTMSTHRPPGFGR